MPVVSGPAISLHPSWPILTLAQKTGHPTVLHLTLIGWSKRFQDAFAEEEGGDVLRNRTRSKTTSLSGSDSCLRSFS
jgi:hypothetical protein